MVDSELKLREARVKAGLSQEELAQLMDVSRQTISKWENGVVRPSAKNLARLSQALGVSMDALLGLQPLQPPERPEEPPAEQPISRRGRGRLVLLAALALAAGVLLGALLFGRLLPDLIPASQSGSEVVASSGKRPEDTPDTEKERPRVFQKWELEHGEIDPSTIIYGKLLPPLPEGEYEAPETQEEQFPPQSLLGAERHSIPPS